MLEIEAVAIGEIVGGAKLQMKKVLRKGWCFISCRYLRVHMLFITKENDILFHDFIYLFFLRKNFEYGRVNFEIPDGRCMMVDDVMMLSDEKKN